jgi:hypothetical protein
MALIAIFSEFRQVSDESGSKVRESWARVGGLAWTYYEIAETAFGRFIHEMEDPPPRPQYNRDPTEWLEHERRLCEAGIQTIVFSAMCAEAAIFDLAAIHLGDAYAEQHIDRLDLISKWVVVPQLICGRTLRLNGTAINSLRATVKARNVLAHPKSLPFDPDPATTANVRKKWAAFPEAVRLSYRALVHLSLEVNDVLGVTAGVLPPFEKGVVSSSEPPDPVRPVIAQCREAHARSKA